MAPPLPLIFLLMIHRVSSSDWGVNYSHLYICALKNSSVIMSCNYTYPTGYKIEKVFWTKNPVNCENSPDLSEDPEYSQRLQYLGDEQKNCTIRLSHVTQKDSHMYYFRFTTDKPDGKWTGKPGVNLTVTDLQVEAPERVTEGDSVRLTCKSSCALTDRATFIWYRNSQPLTERRDRNNQLLLQSVRREDAGRYRCALQEHTYISPAVYLSVTYPPKHTFVAVSPCCELVEGNSVNLSCNSDSYPPALNFSWFKGGTFVGSGRIYSISKISSNHSGEYKCKSVTEHGEAYSDAVTLNVMCVGCPVILYIFIGVFIGAAVVIMVVLIWVKKRKDAQESQMNLSRPHHNICQMSDVKMMDTVYENEMAKQDEEEKRHTGVSAKMNQSKTYHNIYQTSDEKLPESVYEDVTFFTSSSNNRSKNISSSTMPHTQTLHLLQAVKVKKESRHLLMNHQWTTFRNG